MKKITAKTLALFLISIVFSCQDNSLEEVLIEEVDQDMIDALATANDFLSSNNARSNNNSAEVTVLRFQNGLLYRTDTENDSYISLYEETITAESTPGSYIFWHAGIGLGELIGIEFDEDSEEYLGENNLPFEVESGRTWAVFIPESEDDDDDEDDEQILKYDILYRSASGQIIRFDPKIKIRPGAGLN